MFSIETRSSAINVRHVSDGTLLRLAAGNSQHKIAAMAECKRRRLAYR